MADRVKSKVFTDYGIMMLVDLEGSTSQMANNPALDTAAFIRKFRSKTIAICEKY